MCIRVVSTIRKSKYISNRSNQGGRDPTVPTRCPDSFSKWSLAHSSTQVLGESWRFWLVEYSSSTELEFDLLGFMSCLSVTSRFLHVLNIPNVHLPIVLAFMFDDLPLEDSGTLKAEAHTRWFIIILSHHEPMDVLKKGAKYPVNLFQQQLTSACTRLSSDHGTRFIHGPKEVDDKII